MTILNIESYIQKVDLKISDSDRFNFIKNIQDTILSDNWCKNVPFYQTWPDLFERKEEHWISLKEKIEVIFNLQKNQRLTAWAYVSFVGKKGSLGNLWHRHGETNSFSSAVFYLQNNNEFAGTMYMVEDIVISPKVNENTLYMFRNNCLHTPPYWDYKNSKINRIVLAIECNYI